jgi:transcriptional regulator with XRE-family HTH domain
MDVGARIAAWREAKGLSPQELAKRVGVSGPAVYQWEGSGETKTTPTTENLMKVADALGITMEQFWGPLPTAKRKRAKAS